MNTPTNLNKLITFVSACILLMSFSSVQAKAISYVERALPGQVSAFVFSKDGKYVYAGSLSEINVYTRDSETGKLTDIQTLPYPGTSSNFGKESMVISPDGKQLYVRLGRVIQRYNIDSSGMITFHNELKIPSGTNTDALKISTNGDYIYTAGRFVIYTIKRASNGNISLLHSSDENLGKSNTNELELGPNKKTLYVTNAYNDTVHVFKTNSDGSLTNIQIIKAGGYGTTISKDGKYFYSLKRGDGTISIYKRSQEGKLSPFKVITDIPFPSHTPTLNILFGSDNEVLINPNQKYLYINNSIKGNLSVWARNTETGDLTYLDHVDSPTIYSKQEIKISPDNRHLYVASGGHLFDLRADLSLAKTAPSADVAPNGTISYTLAVTNNGLSDAQNVVLTDNLPAGTSFISGTNNNTSDKCTASGQKVTCKMGQIFKGDGYNAIIQVKAPATEGKITNTASVTSDQLDTKTANNTDSADATIKKGGSSLPPVKDGGSGGGSLPLGLLVLLMPVLLRRSFK